MISVGYVLARIRPGGSLTLVRTRIELLATNRVAPQVIALLPTAEDSVTVEVLREWARTGVPVHVVGHRSRRDLLSTMLSLRAAIADLDIVHSVNATQSYVAAAAASLRKPLVRDLVTTAPPSRLGRLVGRMARANVAVSHAVSRAHQAPRTAVVYPPMALERSIVVAPDDLPRGSPTVLVVARFAPGKGLHHLPGIIVAIRSLLPKAHVLIAGDGKGRGDLEREIERRGGSNAVTMLGFRDDVPELHAAADVYLSTSEAEGLVGYATLEAAVNGTPIVATPIPAVTEVLRDGVDACLADPRDPQSVAQAVAGLAADHETASRMVASARARVATMLNPQRSASKLVEVYEGLM